MKELADEKKTMRQLGGKSKYHRANPQQPIHKKYQQQRNQYSEMICKTKVKHWVEWIEGLDK
jgi:hypothetical protein